MQYLYLLEFNQILLFKIANGRISQKQMYYMVE